MKKVRRILFLYCLVLIIGVSVAYKNTKSLMVDNASVISFTTESINVFDSVIYYRDIEKLTEDINNAFNEDFIPIYHKINHIY